MKNKQNQDKSEIPTFPIFNLPCLHSKNWHDKKKYMIGKSDIFFHSEFLGTTHTMFQDYHPVFFFYCVSRSESIEGAFQNRITGRYST